MQEPPFVKKDTSSPQAELATLLTPGVLAGLQSQGSPPSLLPAVTTIAIP